MGCQATATAIAGYVSPQALLAIPASEHDSRRLPLRGRGNREADITSSLTATLLHAAFPFQPTSADTNPLLILA